ncbi:MAG: amino acid adenylation domain-containing protein [Symploca sp. SIO2E6]|nr:amino acid adenylation domain-containing protein [Symploca sp. SIO2E6]
MSILELGKRVQLADIETALLSITEVEQAYVLAHLLKCDSCYNWVSADHLLHLI